MPIGSNYGGGSPSIDAYTKAETLSSTTKSLLGGVTTPDAALQKLNTLITGKAASTHYHAASDINSGTFAVGRGGTGKASWTANRLIYPSASITLAQLAFPTTAQSVLMQNTSGAPYWTTLANLKSLLGVDSSGGVVTGTYVGSVNASDTTPHPVTLGFRAKFLWVGLISTDPAFIPWYIMRIMIARMFSSKKLWFTPRMCMMGIHV